MQRSEYAAMIQINQNKLDVVFYSCFCRVMLVLSCFALVLCRDVSCCTRVVPCCTRVVLYTCCLVLCRVFSFKKFSGSMFFTMSHKFLLYDFHVSTNSFYKVRAESQMSLI